MRKLNGKTYWLVGASEGLGRAVAEDLSRAGVNLVLSARNADRLAELAESLPGEARAVAVDIGDAESVAQAAADVGQIDGMVFLAGVYWPQPAQKWTPGEIEAMCDINLTGAARVLGHVVPDMVARDEGHIVITGSLSGFRGLPGAIGYCASKAGVMSLAESMYADLRKTGVDVQLINPGFIKTRLTDKNDFSMPFIMEPEAAAREFVSHMKTNRFAKNFPTGFSLVFRGSQLMPDWLYYRVFS
ncbi:MAG: SDR family NAD(P)-dependent oxidoreductase [Pseudomonadota bacterium]